MKNRHRLKIRTFLASLWILLSLCDVGYAWQPTTATMDFDKDPIWGDETNCLKAGLLLQYAPDTNHTLVGFFPVLYNSSETNSIPGNLGHLQLWLPPFGRYQMELTDTNGNPVLKSAKGRSLGKAFEPQPQKIDMYHGYERRILHTKTPDVIDEPLVLEDYFTITNAGKYHLAFELIALRGTKQGIQQYHLHVNVEIEIKNP